MRNTWKLNSWLGFLFSSFYLTSESSFFHIRKFDFQGDRMIELEHYIITQLLYSTSLTPWAQNYTGLLLSLT